jgi:hypothetical protein
MAIYGYARVSTDGQSLVAQIGELKSAKSEKVFQEKISGARSDRKQLGQAIPIRANKTGISITACGLPLAARGLTSNRT